VTVIWKGLDLPGIKQMDYVLLPQRNEKLWRYQMDEVFNTPIKANNAQLEEMHAKLRPMTMDHVYHYARKIDPSFKVIDTKEAKFTTWQRGGKFFGMKHKKESKVHGAYRAVLKMQIEEGSFSTGLIRFVEPDKVYYKLWKGSERLAYVEFDADLEEVAREDPEGMFTKITSGTIKV
jgi:hypothetical protein